ncbi:MAG: transcriptional repressor [Solirubrobacterales bacterium]|nr:transcriptional repressor [Solirubrobacterales bacterium]
MPSRSTTVPADLGFAQLLRANGLRATAQRRAIYSVFADAAEADSANAHLSAEEVFQQARVQLPELSRATVYNALGELAEAGLLGLVEGPGPRRYDANVMPHHHFRCRVCHQLHDVELDHVEVTLHERGFMVQSSHVLLEGLCPTCASAADPAPAG